jgi:hypothetical protein
MIAEVTFICLAIWFVITQITIPVAKKTKLFPAFHRTTKVLNSLEVELNQQSQDSERFSELKKKAEKNK